MGEHVLEGEHLFLNLGWGWWREGRLVTEPGDAHGLQFCKGGIKCVPLKGEILTKSVACVGVGEEGKFDVVVHWALFPFFHQASKGACLKVLDAKNESACSCDTRLRVLKWDVADVQGGINNITRIAVAALSWHDEKGSE